MRDEGRDRASVPGAPKDDGYDAWTSRGTEATRRGDFAAALDAYSTARQRAVAEGDAGRVDRADLNLAMVRIQTAEPSLGEEGLREILLRTGDVRVAFSAAYNLASSLRKQGRYEAALRYARRAMERARITGSADLVAPVHNLLGNILLNQNYLDEALVEYDKALALRLAHEGETGYSRAILEENIGYCLLLKRQLGAGLARIRRALALAMEAGDARCEAECLQDLCYGLLLDGRHSEAIGMGEAALTRARLGAYRDIEENCLYLLGELGSRTGDSDRRDRHFDCLQSLHPELPFLRDFLCAVDVTGIITLKR